MLDAVMVSSASRPAPVSSTTHGAREFAVSHRCRDNARMSAEGPIAVRDRTAALIRWILTEGRASPSVPRFIGALCRRLVDEGLPLWRVTIYAATLHPQIRGFGWRWW